MKGFISIFLLVGITFAQSNSNITQQLESLGLSEQQIQELIKSQQKTIRAKSQKPRTVQKEEFKPESLLVKPRKVYSTIEKAFMRNYTLQPDTEIVQFGYEMFKPETLASYDSLGFNLPVGPNYVIGPGDEIIINVWSEIYQQTFDLYVDKYGKIILPKAGATYVWGLTFKEAKDLIVKKMHKHFTNVKFDIALGKLHSTAVFVLGEVARPGLYRTYPLASPIQLLYLAGGIKKTGSLRKIKIIKRNGATKTIDLYDFLIKGRPIPILTFEDGDLIFVPTIGNVVAVVGAVKRPGIYETTNEKTLMDLINLAGGVLPTFYSYHLQLQRVENGKTLKIEDINFKNDRLTLKKLREIRFKSGDLVFVQAVSPELRGYVTVAGNVFRPGRYAINDSTSVPYLIRLAGGLKPGTYMDRAEIIRHADSLQKKIISFSLADVLEGKTSSPRLHEFDTLYIHSISEVVPVDSVTIIGGVGAPGKYQFTIDMTLADLLTVCGGIHAGSDISNIQILRETNGKIKFLKINLNETKAENVHLFPGDLVNIPPPVKLDSSFVIVTGAVRRPGKYVVNPGKDRLIDVINRAGGFKTNAYPAGTEVYRKNIRTLESNTLLMFLDNAYTQILREQNALTNLNISRNRKELRSEYLKKQQKFIEMMIKSLGKDTLVVLDTAKIETLSIILSHLTPFTQGRLALNFKDSSSLNMPVMPGDSIFIPEVSRTVTVMGFVNYPVTVPYVKGKDVDFYIKKAGGYSSIAERGKTFVVLPGGQATTNLDEIEPGSIIMVPGKVELKPTKLEILKDVVGIVYQIALAYIAIRQVTK